MHNPFLESPSNLRKEWKQLRSQLDTQLTDDEHLNLVVKWWAKSPFSRQWLNWDDVSTWPDPWELIATKNLDFSAISLGMEYTLLLGIDGRWESDRVEVWLVSDVSRTMQHLVVAVDGKKILNASYGIIVDLSDEFIIHSKFKYDGKKHVQIF